MIGLGAKIEARHLAQFRLVVVGTFGKFFARVAFICGQGREMGICRYMCMCGEVVIACLDLMVLCYCAHRDMIPARYSVGLL